MLCVFIGVCCAGGSGGGQGDTEDLARLHVELEMKDKELHEKNLTIDHLVTDMTVTCHAVD